MTRRIYGMRLVVRGMLWASVYLIARGLLDLEALASAFPASLVGLATLGLLDVAVTLNPEDFSLRHTWVMMPMLYYIGPLARRPAGRVAADDQRDRNGEVRSELAARVEDREIV